MYNAGKIIGKKVSFQETTSGRGQEEEKIFKNSKFNLTYKHTAYGIIDGDE